MLLFAEVEHSLGGSKRHVSVHDEGARPDSHRGRGILFARRLAVVSHQEAFTHESRLILASKLRVRWPPASGVRLYGVHVLKEKKKDGTENINTQFFA